MSSWKEEWGKTGKAARLTFIALVVLGGFAFFAKHDEPDNPDAKTAPRKPASVAQAAVQVAPPPTARPLPINGKDCTVATCSPGTRVVSLGNKSDKYFACQTKETAEYVNLVVGLIQLQASVTGSLPNISPQTGEPEYQGETKQMIDGLRAAAGVQTFGEAMTNYCIPGKPGRRFMVMNNPGGGGFIWVGDTVTNQTLWYPNTFIKPM